MSEPLALSAREVARRLSCSRSHVYNLIEAGELPTVPHMGNRKVVPTEAVDRLVRQALTPQLVRCTPCWMGSHRQCEHGACTCTDSLHSEQGEGVGLQSDPLENRAGSSAQKAG